MPYQPTPRPAQRLGGLLIGLLGLGFGAWLWRLAVRTGDFRPQIALFGAFAVIGFALVCIPGYREERLARGEDISRLEGAQLFTRRWWLVLGLAFAVGGGSAVALWWRLVHQGPNAPAASARENRAS